MESHPGPRAMRAGDKNPPARRGTRVAGPRGGPTGAWGITYTGIP